MGISLKFQQATSRNASSSFSTTFWFTVKGSPGKRGKLSGGYPTSFFSPCVGGGQTWKSKANINIPASVDGLLACKQKQKHPHVSAARIPDDCECPADTWHWHQQMFSQPDVTAMLSLFLGFLERSPPRGPSLSTGLSMCSEAESTQRWWRWKMWRMEQVCVCLVRRYVHPFNSSGCFLKHFSWGSCTFWGNAAVTHSLYLCSLFFKRLIQWRKCNFAMTAALKICIQHFWFHVFVHKTTPRENRWLSMKQVLVDS